VNESTLTGESLSISKNKNTESNRVFEGTTVTGGLAICVVEQIGKNTALGKIGQSIESIKDEETPLQRQVRNFVKKMALVGMIIFLIVWAINYFQSHQLVDSLLKALTLAMSILPEEIPVAFTTFMAIGAWRLMKLGIIVRQTKTVEALGSATVICTDKTGTITENEMSIARYFDLSTNTIYSFDPSDIQKHEVITYGMWASEPIPFDPMEIALHEAYRRSVENDERKNYRMVHEYPLSGRPPMMTHIFRNEPGDVIISAKGAPEAIMNVSALSQEQRASLENAIHLLSSAGYRLLGVATAKPDRTEYPATQQEFLFHMKGLVAFYDPPKKNIASVFESFYSAGIEVKIITGDNATTTRTIARQVNFRGWENTIEGDELLQLDDEQIRKKVMEVSIFTRMFPEAKLRILNALKANGQVVAMTGDGVNDGPALKAAHIGIAMGRRGAEIAKEVSSLILTDDDLAKMIDAIAMGRKIYANLKKAIQYIISIHIPIVLTVFIPLVLGWVYPYIFTPVHIIFLELIMGPTCSIIYENEPMEKDTMLQKPRPMTTTFFNIHELTTSIIQGLMITLGILTIYLFAVHENYSEAMTRTMIFVCLISANISLTLSNRSFYHSILVTLRYKNSLVPLIILITFFLTGIILVIPGLLKFFSFERLNAIQLLGSALVGLVSVIWFEIIKFIKRQR
jgi:Ca2+-transporting ATPase